MRELLTRYGRNNIGFLWLFLEPMLFTLAITIFWAATRSIHGSAIPITAFALTGYSSVLLWRNMVGRCINAIETNKAAQKMPVPISIGSSRRSGVAVTLGPSHIFV